MMASREVGREDIHNALQDRVAVAVQKTGISKKLKSELRYRLIESLQKEIPYGGAADVEPLMAQPPALVDRAIYSLILELLRTRGKLYSLSVLLPECGMNAADILCLDEIGRALSLERVKVFVNCRAVASEDAVDGAGSGKCTLERLLQALSATREPVCTVQGTQTDSIGLGLNLEAKLRACESSTDAAVDRRSTEEKMLQFQARCEARCRKEADAEIARIRSIERERIALEEAAKSRADVQEVILKAGREAREREQKLRAKEEAALERLKAKSVELDKKAIEWRAEAQRTVEDTNRRQQTRMRQLEIEEQRVNAQVKTVETRERDVVQRESRLDERIATMKAELDMNMRAHKAEVESNVADDREAVRRRELALERDAIVRDREGEKANDVQQRLTASETALEKLRSELSSANEQATVRERDLIDCRRQSGLMTDAGQQSQLAADRLRSELICLQREVETLKRERGTLQQTDTARQQSALKAQTLVEAQAQSLQQENVRLQHDLERVRTQLQAGQLEREEAEARVRGSLERVWEVERATLQGEMQRLRQMCDEASSNERTLQDEVRRAEEFTRKARREAEELKWRLASEAEEIKRVQKQVEAVEAEKVQLQVSFRKPVEPRADDLMLTIQQLEAEFLNSPRLSESPKKRQKPLASALQAQLEEETRRLDSEITAFARRESPKRWSPIFGTPSNAGQDCSQTLQLSPVNPYLETVGEMLPEGGFVDTGGAVFVDARSRYAPSFTHTDVPALPVGEMRMRQAVQPRQQSTPTPNAAHIQSLGATDNTVATPTPTGTLSFKEPAVPLAQAHPKPHIAAAAAPSPPSPPPSPPPAGREIESTPVAQVAPLRVNPIVSPLPAAQVAPNAPSAPAVPVTPAAEVSLPVSTPATAAAAQLASKYADIVPAGAVTGPASVTPAPARELDPCSAAAAAPPAPAAPIASAAPAAAAVPATASKPPTAAPQKSVDAMFADDSLADVSGEPVPLPSEPGKPLNAMFADDSVEEAKEQPPESIQKPIDAMFTEDSLSGGKKEVLGGSVSPPKSAEKPMSDMLLDSSVDEPVKLSSVGPVADPIPAPSQPSVADAVAPVSDMVQGGGGGDREGVGESSLPALAQERPLTDMFRDDSGEEATHQQLVQDADGAQSVSSAASPVEQRQVAEMFQSSSSDGAKPQGQHGDSKPVSAASTPKSSPAADNDRSSAVQSFHVESFASSTSPVAVPGSAAPAPTSPAVHPVEAAPSTHTVSQSGDRSSRHSASDGSLPSLGIASPKGVIAAAAPQAVPPLASAESPKSTPSPPQAATPPSASQSQSAHSPGMGQDVSIGSLTPIGDEAGAGGSANISAHSGNQSIPSAGSNADQPPGSARSVGSDGGDQDDENKSVHNEPSDASGDHPAAAPADTSTNSADIGARFQRELEARLAKAKSERPAEVVAAAAQPESSVEEVDESEGELEGHESFDGDESDAWA